MTNLETADTVDGRCVGLASRQYGVISRGQALELGLSPAGVKRRVDRGVWRPIHEGVYVIGAAVETWRLSLMAACLHGGPRAVASHRAAAVLWALDGLVRAPVEITVPHGEEALARHVVTHRSRILECHDVATLGGIPVTNVPRTLVDLGRFEHDTVVEKALESALRKRLTTEATCWRYVDDRAGRIPGAARLRRVLRVRTPGSAAESGGEVAFLRLLRAAGVPAPIRQFPLILPGGGTARLDFAWPQWMFAVEFDGFDHHGGRLAHAADMERQNAIVALGWDLRRYTGTTLRRKPDRILEEVTARLSA